MCFLFPSVFYVLNPQIEVAVEPARGSVENKENAPLTAVSSRPHSESLHSLFAESVQIHFIFNISHKITRLGATCIQLVLEVGAFLDDRGDFILITECTLADTPLLVQPKEAYLAKQFLSLILF